MAIGTQGISDEIWQAGNFKVLISTIMISNSICDKLNEKPETMQQLDEKIQETFASFVTELLDREVITSDEVIDRYDRAMMYKKGE